MALSTTEKVALLRMMTNAYGRKKPPFHEKYMAMVKKSKKKPSVAKSWKY
jgi:hypothetical protein